MTLFIFFSVAIAAVDAVTLVMSARQRDRDGRLLACAIACAMLVALGYLFSVVATDYFLMSLASSIYFASIDIMLVFTLAYFFSMTDQWRSKVRFWLVALFAVLACVDVTILLVNPFNEIAISYVYNPDHLAHYSYNPKFLYICHLGLCYVLVVVCMVVIMVKVAHAPSVFRGRYFATIAGVLVTVFVNALFLYIPRTFMLDYSLIFYSVMCVYLYLTEFFDAPRRMLAATHEIIFDNLGRAVFLFDYEGRYAISNNDAQRLLPEEKRNRHYRLRRFLDEYGLGEHIKNPNEDCTFRCKPNIEGSAKTYRVDYQVLKDNRSRVLGTMLVLVDTTMRIDLLTGFHTKNAFDQEFDMRRGRIVERPVVACACDLNNLANLNAKLGRDLGDEAIRVVADAMVKHFPPGTYFTRHDEANLVAVCLGAAPKQVRECAKAVRAEVRDAAFANVRLEVQTALAVDDSDVPSVLQTARTAVEALRLRKMLDFDAAHSSLLSSLAMTQRQSDGETEAHVRRTRAVADRMAQRLGMSDWDRSSLALLCLLHDIGKVGVPLEILNKPGKLSDQEWEIMKSHTTKGYMIAQASEELSVIADCILHHHERWDGQGYPDGLAGADIPLMCRILAVVDTYDAMTHDRVYRKGAPKEVALQELRDCSGTQFDPAVVADFLHMMDEDMSFDASLVGDQAYDRSE
ncbi:MAG: HD domain-containing protein [Coriobacteriia bacterium]|nr:HD domain-containing protein [Coriobacteriia bacterium]